MLDLSSISATCVKCAKCIPSCTIYQVNRDEVTSPRGFVDLLGIYDKGEINLDNNLKNIFETCFLCTTCTTVCPQVIDTASMIQQSRIDIAKKFGISWYKKLYFYLLKHRKLMDITFKFVNVVSPCFFKRNGDKLRSRFSVSKFGKRTIFPFVNKSFLEMYQGHINSLHNTNGLKVAIFIGCLSNYNYKNVGESLLFILDRLGIDVVVPKQECCGAPAYFTGDIDSVVYLIRKNLDLFESFIHDVDFVLVPEATCAAMIISDWKHALEYVNDPHNIERLNNIIPKIRMATDYLYNETNLSSILQSLPTIDAEITYHDPCHAKKVLNVYKEPRCLLKENYKFIEMDECDRCCGFGGVTMQTEKYNLSYHAGIPKAFNIDKSGAKIVSSECSACRMQLNNALDNIDSKVVFKHPLELIKEALQNESS